MSAVYGRSLTKSVTKCEIDIAQHNYFAKKVIVMKHFTVLLFLSLPITAQAEDVVPQEFTADQMALFIDRACLTENPKRYIPRAGYLGDLGWPKVDQNEAVTYTSPGGGVVVYVTEGMLDARCEWTIAQGAVGDNFNAIAVVQAKVDEQAKEALDPTTEGEAFVWNWSGSGSYMMQSYSARVVDNAGVAITWATE